MDVMLRQMPVTVKTGAVVSRAHVEMQKKVETWSQPSRLQPQITNASSVKLVTEASKSSTSFPQPCSESKIVTNSANRRPLIFSPSKSFISDSLKFFRSIKHDRGGKKTKNLGCAEVPISKHHMVFTSALAIKEDNLLEVDSATQIKPLLMPVENFSELGLTKRVRKTNYVNTAVQNLTGWLHSVWSYRSPRPFSKSHTTSVAPDELYLCNDCEQQILSELLRSNNIQIAVRYATPEGLWQENKTANIISSKVAAEGPESGYLVKDPIVEHDQESFSRFLHKVPLAEIKTVSHLADLCSLAYMIPEMKTGALLSQHKLKFVTSSLDRKAQASEKEKAANKVISLSANESQNMIKASISNDACSLSSSVWYTATSGAPSCSLPDGNSVFQLECEKSDVGNGLRAQIFDAVFPVDVKIAKNVVHGQVFSSLGHGKNFAALECYAKHHSLDDLPQSTPKASLLQPCPCGWFCCDDIAARTRYFVIQGSESLASWQANLAFDPVQFEDASLGVLVHRGIYEAAKGLYQQLLPDIIEHLKKHGNAGRIRFTGHSLGGNLATLLFMMLRIRKTVTAEVLLPVVTFGSPSIMCGGDNMLEKLSIPRSHIQSVVMHRDIVPRSFSCHYPDHIAEVLKRIYGVFRQHACLIHQSLLYTPMGDFYILQPDKGIAPPHPFLPEGSGLYLMRHPIQPQDNSKISLNAELQTALRAFFNSPHPLEILGNPGSYGSNGSIARNHDPRSYTKALDVVLLQELERQMHEKSKKNRQLWWPLFAALSSVESIGGLGVIQSQASRGAISSTVGVMHHELRQSVSCAMRGGQHMSMVTALGANLSRHVRYKRLIASQHVQIGIFFILSAKVVLLQAPLAVVACV